MNDQPEALRLANSLAAHSLSRHGQTQAAAELRRLYAECEALRAENEHLRKTAHEHVSRALYDAHTAELRAEADALRAELREVTEAMNDPAVNNIRTLAESIRILQAECDALRAALKDIADDYEDRFDMNDPSTNPGIKHVVREARAALKEANHE